MSSLTGKQFYCGTNFLNTLYTPGRQQSKTLILSMNVDKKSLETEFLIAICRLTGDKWQSKTLFLMIFDPCPLIKSVFDCSLPGVSRSIKTFALLLVIYCHSVSFDRKLLYLNQTVQQLIWVYTVDTNYCPFCAWGVGGLKAGMNALIIMLEIGFVIVYHCLRLGLTRLLQMMFSK